MSRPPSCVFGFAVILGAISPALGAAPGAAASCVPTGVISLDGDHWLLAPDPKNVGRQEEWWKAPRPEAKRTKVPWIIQDAFPGYHGVAWYWRDFEGPANDRPGGRCLLRFWAVDYTAEVWLNGARVGAHEGAESPFVFDVTQAVKPNESNRLAVRVLNPTHDPIDGIVLAQTPHRNKALPYGSGSAWDQGGIWDSVELLLAPAVRVEDLFVRPEWKTGNLRFQANLRNASASSISALVELSVAPAAGGETIAAVRIPRELPSGDTLVEGRLAVPNPRLWELNDPFLYRVTCRVTAEAPALVDEHSVRCGFRDFRFENGAFRLNGKRIYLRCSHTGNCCPIGLEMPHDPDILRRDLVNAKMMRFNAIRFIAGVAKRYQLDLCDEIGLMVYEESYASWCLADSPKMGERYDESILGMVRRDRNHPSITMWGLLNETPDGSVFQHAAGLLPAVRRLDDSRMVMLGSGRWDGRLDLGSLSNPGSSTWDGYLGGEKPGASRSKMSSPGGYCERMGDAHAYPRVPHSPETIRFLREVGRDAGPVFLSEYGIGSAVDLLRVCRLYEQAGKADVEDARFYAAQRDRYLADWQRWRMAEAFDRPEDFFAQSNARMAGQRLLGLNAIRSNPNVIGHSLTGTVDQGMTGEGLWTTFRELKPGTVDALFDGLAPLRWCLFVEPVNVYRNTSVRLEAVLANEDALAPGEYPVRLQVVGPNVTRVFEKTVTVRIGNTTGKAEPPMAMPVFAEDVVIDGPPGTYRFMAVFEKGAAAAGGEVQFFVDVAPPDMPKVEAEVALCSQDRELAGWLADRGVRTRPHVAGSPTAREAILVSGRFAEGTEAETLKELARRIARGSTVVFLTPDVFARGDHSTFWLPVANKGNVSPVARWLYHADDWAKRHPIFDGLPTGGLMDYAFYRELIPDVVWMGQAPPAHAVAGAINASQGYQSGLLVAVYELGAGRFVLNTLRIRENLGRHPAAERLLRNMLRYAARDLAKPAAALPPDFDKTLEGLGYR